MKLGKQILAFLLSAFVAVPLLGCGDGSAQLIERMSERMQNVQSARMGMTMDLGLSAGGQSTALSMDMQIDYMQEPLAMKIEMGLSGISTEDASDRLTMYLQQTDSLLHTYCLLYTSRGF